jgi:NADH:ubiquinone oxidoreductase subunit F (NADH-binding)
MLTHRLLPIDPQTGRARDLRSLAAHAAAFGPLPTLPLAANGHPGALIEAIAEARLCGRGGGWFPTARKMQAVVDSAAGRRQRSPGSRPVVIANAMEGEPASGKDAVLLAHVPHLILDGIQAAAATVGATDAYLAVHRGTPTIDDLDRAIAERRSDPVRVELITPPARYVASEESALAHWAGDGSATPVYGDRPFERGMNGRPTLVQNVETLAHLGLIARHGGAWFAEVGDAQAPGTTLVTVGGRVRQPGVIEVPTGTPVSELLARCGDVDGPVEGFLTGGYGGAWVASEALWSAEWAPAQVREAGGVIGAGILWALDAGICPLHEIARVATYMAGESAGQCGPCRFGLPSVADDLTDLARASSTREDLARINARLALVVNRGGCKHPDGTARFIGTGLTVFSEEVAEHLRGGCSASRSRNSLPIPQVRKSPVKRAGKDFR